tara:strand:- start:55053 stop:55262 length:210 start_codon:yes stop_codon:yes gene_type:complete
LIWECKKMNEKLYKIYELYLKITNSKKIKRKELDTLKKEIGKDILNTKLREEEVEEVDLSFYFDSSRKK